jgi:glucose/arabinose dehydrogenase/PKD repeat protein
MSSSRAEQECAMQDRFAAGLRALVSGVLAVGVLGSVLAGAPQQVAASGAGPGPGVRVPVSRAPAGFSDTQVLSAASPTALAWTPDGRMLVTTKAGRLVVVRDGERSIALDIRRRICDQGERGLLGVAVDPAFEENHFIYLYYTHKVRGSCGSPRPCPASRVGRFVLDDRGVDRAGETVIVDRLVSPRPNHLGGDLEFGEDGFLYITVGDGTCSLVDPRRCGPLNDNAQLRRVPLGKVLRVTRNGRPAPGNPYLAATGARRCTRPGAVPAGAGPCKEVFAVGFRNPFRFARKPGTSTFFVMDVGLHTWEEVDRLRRGGNYGWNVREGHCARDSVTHCGRAGGFVNPVHDYRHGRCRSITGGAFVPRNAWPGYNGSFLYGDFACGRVFRLSPDGDGGFTRSRFLTGLRGPVHLRFGPYRDASALYYASFFGNSVHRVARTTENTPPVAAFRYVPDGRVVSLRARRSSDPDGDRIARYSWDFGDGSTLTSTAPRVAHSYATTGPFPVTLTVTDARGVASTPVTHTVHAGEHLPTIEVTMPSTAARFRVGQALRLRAVASDQEDGVLDGTAITWRLLLRHANHSHPYAGPVEGQSLTTTYPAPEELAAARNSFLLAVVTATDSRGLSTTLRQRLLPRTVKLTLRSRPGGAALVAEGVRRQAPFAVTSWAGYVFPVSAPNQRVHGAPHVFQRWSDGKAQRHRILTPRRPQTYVARFVRK